MNVRIGVHFCNTRSSYLCLRLGGFRAQKIWIMTPCSLMVIAHKTTWHNNPEDVNLCFLFLTRCTLLQHKFFVMLKMAAFWDIALCSVVKYIIIGGSQVWTVWWMWWHFPAILCDFLQYQTCSVRLCVEGWQSFSSFFGTWNLDIMVCHWQTFCYTGLWDH
jgi:hypothetical protein